MTENPENERDTTKGSFIVWALPYLAMSGCVLGMLSWVVGSYLLPQIPLWSHAAAIAAALAILAVTLYALSRAGLAGRAE